MIDTAAWYREDILGVRRSAGNGVLHCSFNRQYAGYIFPNTVCSPLDGLHSRCFAITADGKRLLCYHWLKRGRLFLNHRENNSSNCITYEPKHSPAVCELGSSSPLTTVNAFLEFYSHFNIRLTNSCMATKCSIHQLSCQGYRWHSHSHCAFEVEKIRKINVPRFNLKDVFSCTFTWLYNLLYNLLCSFSSTHLQDLLNYKRFIDSTHRNPHNWVQGLRVSVIYFF